jgi:hypothetical protein
MPVCVLRNKSPQQVCVDVDGFAARYAEDWRAWLAAGTAARSELFGQILRKWQATRPLAMRRLRAEARHNPPFLEDLLTEASEHIAGLGNLNVLTIRERTKSQSQALMDLWRILGRLPTSGTASCVGISKALLLLTEGRLGPAFDSIVRKQLGIGKPRNVTCAVWIATLEEVAEDIRAFEAAHGSLTKAVPQCFAHLAYGRLYDMALGPR